MHRFLLHLFCLLTSVLSRYADASNDHPPYDVHRLYRRWIASHGLKDQYPALANHLLLNPPRREFPLEPPEHLLRNASKCVDDIFYTLGSLGDFSNPWALRMLDSFAKPPESGILVGNSKWIGDYNECVRVQAPPSNSTAGNFNGQYCSMTYTLPLFNFSLPLTFAVCLPDSCSPDLLRDEILHLLFQAGGFPVSNETSVPVTLTCLARDRPWSTGAISVIAMLSVFCALALAGSSMTVVKYCQKIVRERKKSSLIVNVSNREEIITEENGELKKNVESDDVNLLQIGRSNDKGFLETFLTCFCVFTNGAKLLNTDSSEGQLLCIHGIRFLSMSWVILGHAYMFGFQEIRNMMETMDVLNDFPFQVVLQGFFSVDSFFVLSGFLLSYLAMKEFSKTRGSINWFYFYAHRYIRLTPIYMVLLGFSATVFYYLGSGPYWPTFVTDPNCVDSWWWNLLYINNFVDQAKQCMGWSWYLANDMQFFAISPIFLISLWRWPRIGLSIVGLFVAACMLSNFFITYHFDLMVGLVGVDLTASNTLQAMLKFSEYFDKIYIKPYTRIGPYLAGVVVGYILFKHKANNRPRLRWFYLCLGWTAASAVTLTCVYGLYKSHPSKLARSFYGAFNRTLFGWGLSWVIYVCLTNQSDIVNHILSYKLFIPLSRLTYAAYLIHPMIITGYFASLKRPLQFSHPTLVILFLGFMVVTYALALPVSLILESPMVSLEKLVRSRFTRKQTKAVIESSTSHNYS